METLTELQSMLKRIEDRWNIGILGSPDEIVDNAGR
jgi:hypothetical protein